MAYPYNSRLPWPFPVLPITVYRYEGQAISPVLDALLDTGADSTLIPSKSLVGARAEILRTARIRSHWGEPRLVNVYQVDLAIAEQRLSGVEVVADGRGKEAILGRNVLNKLILLLDGFRHQTDVLTQRPRRL